MQQTTSSSAPVVLLVEDDGRIATFMIRGLRAMGFAPEWVTTAAEAMERIESGRVDVHVLDLGLPDMDGLELLRQLNSSAMTPPTVVVTARTDPRDRRTALDLGVRAYITKPFPFASLVAAVRECAAAPAPAGTSTTGSARDA